MNPLPLRIRPSRAAPGHPAAVLLTAGSALPLLRQLDALGLQRAPLYPMAADANRTFAGLFVPLQEPWGGAPPPQLALYQRLGSHLYFPVDGECVPPIRPDEADALCAGRIHVLHPTLGLRVFEPADAVPMTALLTAPSQDPTSWDLALPGLAPLPPLTAVLQELPDADEVDGAEAADGIGEEEPPKKIARRLRRAAKQARSELGPRNRPSAAGTRDGRRRSPNPILRGVARIALGVTRLIPERGVTQTMWNRLENWALDTLGQAPSGGFWSSLGSDWFGGGSGPRGRSTGDGDDAIAWLIRKLHDDPDTGLRHAIPFGGTDGQLPDHGASNFILPNNPVDFRLDAGAGGGSGICISPHFYRALQRLYRELAQRELNLGRPRRAAYILSNLLNDHRGAANALKGAGFYREAATLFRDRCDDVGAAARCLKANGDHLEAAEMFEQIGEFRSAGRERQQVGQHEAAAALFARQIRVHADNQAFAAAAEVAEQDLRQTEWALTLLMHGFEKGHDAERCLASWFEVTAHYDQTDRALRFVESVRSASLTRRESGRALAMARALATQAHRFPSPEVREAAADGCRVLAGSALTPPRWPDADAFLQALRSVAAEDKQLRVDIERFRRSGSRSARSPARNRDEVLLPGQPIAAAASVDGLLVLTKTSPRTVRLLEWTPQDKGLRQLATWTDVQFESGWLFSNGKTRDGAVIVPGVGSQRLPPRKAYRDIHGYQQQVGTLDGVPDHVVACAEFGEFGGVRSFVCNPPREDPSLIITNRRGGRVRQHAITLLSADSSIPCLLVAESALLEVVKGGLLCTVREKTKAADPGDKPGSQSPDLVIPELEIPTPVQAMAAVGRGQAIVTTDSGAYLVSFADNQFETQLFSPDSTGHTPTGIGGSRFVLWDRDRQFIYRLENGGVRAVSAIRQPPHRACVAVWPSPRDDECFFVIRQGEEYLLQTVSTKP